MDSPALHTINRCVNHIGKAKLGASYKFCQCDQEQEIIIIFENKRETRVANSLEAEPVLPLCTLLSFYLIHFICIYIIYRLGFLFILCRSVSESQLDSQTGEKLLF